MAMEEKEIPMDYLTPIVKLDEDLLLEENTKQKSSKSKKKLDQQPNETTAIKEEDSNTAADIVKVEIKEETKVKEEFENEDDENKPLKSIIEETETPNTEDTIVKPKRGRPKKNDKTPRIKKKIVKKQKIKKDKNNETSPRKKEKKVKKAKAEDLEDPIILFKCPLCKESEHEMNRKDLKKHYKELHPGKRLRTSRFSGETHPCEICGKEFRTTTSLKDHMDTHDKYYYCEVCNHSCKKILDHIIHLRVHATLGLFQCLMCEFSHAEINCITDHVNNHEDVLRYWCESCKKGFQILQHFQEHDNYHTGLKPFDCEFCGRSFLYSRYLHAHKTTLHADVISIPTLHQCVICHKEYQHKNSLKLHMNCHTGNFAICDVCGKTLSSKEKLKFHLRTHTGYKPYSCQYCGKSFTKKPILVEHIRIHTGERPYICDFCTKAFSQRSSLVIHMRGHTGEKPYVCELCNKGFVARAMLNIHLKSCRGSAEMKNDLSQIEKLVLANFRQENGMFYPREGAFQEPK